MFVFDLDKFHKQKIDIILYQLHNLKDSKDNC
jgi:hypothetical protein